MSANIENRCRKLLTIGHSNHDEAAFVGMLKSHGIEILVDVRTQPYSAYSPQFSRDPLKAVLHNAGIRYLFLGKELGGRPDGDDFYDAQGHVLYEQVAASPLFLEGIDRLERVIDESRPVMMCSEENPAECHRYLLVGRVMTSRGTTLEHIRRDGRLDTDADLRKQRLQTGDCIQPLLFGELEEPAWRSLRSVLPKQPRARSSES